MAKSKRSTETATPQVYISIDGDEDARRIAAVLEALGYTVRRQLDKPVTVQTHLDNAAALLGRRHKLTERERNILDRVLVGKHNTAIAQDLDISRATVKWHMHNIFTKTNTGTREGLLRATLQLIGA